MVKAEGVDAAEGLGGGGGGGVDALLWRVEVVRERRAEEERRFIWRVRELKRRQDLQMLAVVVAIVAVDGVEEV